MKTIKENTSNELIIKSSRFITKLIKISNESDVKDHLSNIKETYPDATHYCYAYIISSSIKASDDKEPSGTAGLPMLNVLQKNNLNNVLAITIRYFGGIKLGASSLVRAYTKSLTLALKNTTLCELVPAYIIEITTNYDNQKKLDYHLKNQEILKKEFSSTIKYTICIEEDHLNEYKIYNPKIISSTYKEKS